MTLDSSTIQFRDRAQNDSSVYPITKQSAVMDASCNQDLTQYFTEYNVSMHRTNSTSGSARRDTSVFILSEAIAHVPTEYRHGGLKLIFNTSASNSSAAFDHVAQYMLDSNVWTTTASKWKQLDSSKLDDIEVEIGDVAFATSQKVNTVRIVNDTSTGGVNDVLAAEQGKVLEEEISQLDQKVSQLSLQNGYFTCGTGASTAAKTVSATGFSLPTSGGSIKIKFTYANTASSPTLNINSTGAKAILYNGAVASAENSWDAGEVVEFYYDPSYNSNAGAWVGNKSSDFYSDCIGENQKQINSRQIINLYNKDDKNCESGYIYPSSGIIVASAILKVSGYIPVIEGKSYCVNYGNSNVGYAFYTKNGVMLEYAAQSFGIVMVAPTGASFLRVTVLVEKDGTENIVNEGSTLQSYVDFGIVDINSTTIDKYAVSNIKNNTIETSVVAKSGLSPNDCNFFNIGVNLYNKNDADCVNNKYVDYNSGNLIDITTLKVSGWIRVYPGLYYISNSTGQGAFYDRNKNYISGVQIISIVFQAPENAVWFRGSFKMADENINRLNQSQTLLDYTDYNYPKIKDEAMDAKYNPDTLFIASVNLYDKNAVGCLDSKYMYSANGTTLSYANNASLKVSDFVAVVTGQVLYANRSFNYAFFDTDKNYIENSLTSWVNSVNPFTVPSGAAFVRLTYYRDYDYQNRLSVNYLHPYVEAGKILKTPYYNLKNNRQYESNLGCTGTSVESASLQDTTLQISNFPNSIHKGYKISFEALITSFGSSDKLSVGKGPTAYGSNYLTITSSNTIVYQYKDGILTEIYNQAHGLTLNTYIKVNVNQKTDDTQDIIIETLAGMYSFTINGYYAWCGTPFAKSEGCSLTNCKLSINNSLLKCSVWAFGDSYYGEATENREMYWLKQWGYLNFFVQGYGGQSSVSAEEDLEKALMFGCPKWLIWSLGMNDDNASDLTDIEDSVWYANYLKVKSICNNRNIELILTTIPVPASTNYRNKQLITDFIKSNDCGCRYIDAYKAVGSNSSGEWYGNNTEYDYQTRGSDNVHPSVYGAKAIATQFLVDVPEIIQ